MSEQIVSFSGVISCSAGIVATIDADGDAAAADAEAAASELAADGEAAGASEAGAAELGDGDAAVLQADATSSADAARMMVRPAGRIGGDLLSPGSGLSGAASGRRAEPMSDAR